jgi:hypothetical protein
LGCPGGSPPVEAGSSGTTEGSGPVITGDTTLGPGMTGPVVTGTAGATDDATIGTAGATDTGGGGCADEPPPRGVECQPSGLATIGWQLRVDGAELLDEEVTLGCTVLDVVDDGMMITTVTLDCMGSMAELQLVTLDPHHVPSFAPDDPVELHASAYFEDEAVVARYLTLRRGGLALAAFDASEFAPPAGFDFEPVTIAMVGSDCPAMPTECVLEQDAALQVDFDGQTALLFQGQDAFVGQLTSYRVITGQVEQIVCIPDDCGYSYAEWFVQGLVFREPEG